MSDGTRTRDTRDHNPVLYQLSYTHHRTVHIVAAQAGSLFTTSAAAFWACSEVGPGGGTNTVPR